MRIYMYSYRKKKYHEKNPNAKYYTTKNKKDYTKKAVNF